MTITPLPQAADNADAATEKARQLQRRAERTGVAESQRKQAGKIARDFETLFVGMMVKSMRDTVGKDKLTGGGHGEDVYRSLLDQEYAAAMVKRGGVGLAPLIEKEIIRQEERRAPRAAGETKQGTEYASHQEGL